jgi:deazaflavin-dependent oxidoreductase (nitroreductase family)
MLSTESSALTTKEPVMSATHTTHSADSQHPTIDPGSRYLRPGWFTRNVFNRLMAVMTKLGLSVRGSRVLRVRGRTSGEWRSVPVNPLTVDGRTYLVAPRGVTEWVRNIRAAGGGELQLGRRRHPITIVELAADDDAKVALLRAYLRAWKMEVGAFFEGVGPDAADADLRRIAPGYPVFAVTDAARS